MGRRRDVSLNPSDWGVGGWEVMASPAGDWYSTGQSTPGQSECRWWEVGSWAGSSDGGEAVVSNIDMSRGFMVTAHGPMSRDYRIKMHYWTPRADRSTPDSLKPASNGRLYEMLEGRTDFCMFFVSFSLFFYLLKKYWDQLWPPTGSFFVVLSLTFKKAIESFCPLVLGNRNGQQGDGELGIR